jgi:hypothetical protein
MGGDCRAIGGCDLSAAVSVESPFEARVSRRRRKRREDGGLSTIATVCSGLSNAASRMAPQQCAHRGRHLHGSPACDRGRLDRRSAAITEYRRADQCPAHGRCVASHGAFRVAAHPARQVDDARADCRAADLGAVADRSHLRPCLTNPRGRYLRLSSRASVAPPHRISFQYCSSSRLGPVRNPLRLAARGFVRQSLTRLRDFPYWAHLIAVILWCCAGCPPVGALVT